MENIQFDEGVNNFVWTNFCNLFPDFVNKVTSVQRAGSKMISMELIDGTRLWFLYYTPVNWNLGTKPFRMKPKNHEDQNKEQTDKEV